MEQVKINNKDVIVMNLTHYFITEENYNPVVVHGINDEIWLENMNSDYKIIRIVSKYIHNNEQLNFDRFRSKQITKKLKKKTFSFKMNVINIYIDLWYSCVKSFLYRLADEWWRFNATLSRLGIL